MAEIILNTGTLSLENNNTYIVDKELDYATSTVSINGNCEIIIKNGGFIKNANIDNSNKYTVYLTIDSQDKAVQGVTYIGNFIQKKDILVTYTVLLENYTLPSGFTIRSLFYKEQGDLGGTRFEVIPYSKFNHRMYLYPFNPRNEKSPVIVYCQKDKYWAEELGIFKSGINDSKYTENNRKQLERHGGRSFIIKFGLGYYHINNVNMDNCVNQKGEMGSFYSMNLEGSTNDYSESDGKTFIVTDRSNFIYSVKRGHFKCSVKYMNIETSAGNHFTSQERIQKRVGYGFTRFNKDPLTNDDALPSNDVDISVNLQNVLLYGFWAGFYSGQWSTACTVRSTTFSGCRYGFYTELSSNLSLFENISIHSCAFGLTVGGDKCTIRRVEITPENWYRDEDAVKTPWFYGYRSNSGFQSCYLEDVYLEDYMGDTETRAKFIVFSVSAASSIVFSRCSFQEVKSPTAAYHLEIFRNTGYPYENLQISRPIANFINSSLPVKVRTDENWVLTGICNDGRFINTSASYKQGDETITVKFFSGRGVLHFWKGKPELRIDTTKNIHILFSEKQHMFYEALTQANVNKPVLMRHILNSFNFVAPYTGRLLNLNFNIKGTCQMKLPFIVSIGKIKLVIVPYEVDGIIKFDFSWSGSVYKEDIIDNGKTYFTIKLDPISVDTSDSDFLPIGLSENCLKIIDIEDVEFKLYEI